MTTEYESGIGKRAMELFHAISRKAGSDADVVDLIRKALHQEHFSPGVAVQPFAERFERFWQRCCCDQCHRVGSDARAKDSAREWFIEEIREAVTDALEAAAFPAKE
jgi:hypothetical protein